jgi:hypothetical protein
MHAGSSGFRRAILGGAGTLALVAGMTGALGPAVPASAAPAVAAQSAATSSLTCFYRIINVWPGGFTVQITIVNPGSSPLPGWSLTWTWPGNQQIVSVMNASIVQSGPNVRLFSNAVIPPFATITITLNVVGTPPPVLPIPCTPLS